MFTVVNVALSAQDSRVCCTRFAAEWLILVLLEGDANLLSSSYNTRTQFSHHRTYQPPLPVGLAALVGETQKGPEEVNTQTSKVKHEGHQQQNREGHNEKGGKWQGAS